MLLNIPKYEEGMTGRHSGGVTAELRGTEGLQGNEDRCTVAIERGVFKGGLNENNGESLL